jgi:glutathione S-transferase
MKRADRASSPPDKDASMANMKFYMTPGSCSTAIHILLEELEETFEAHIVNLPAGDHLRPEYVAINPKSTIPVLVRRDGTALTEMVAIAYWLGLSHPRSALWPQDAERQTRLIEAMAYIVATVHGQGFQRIFATANFARAPEEQARVRGVGRDIVLQGFSVLSAALADAPYLAGGFSIADPLLFYVEFWADKTEIALPPNLAAHYLRMLQRPAVDRVLREEGYDTKALGSAYR